ncbi:MAG TPA: oxygen-independent coproporphyrinogen III oxidase [Ilumatobacteraceae bacterium]|nr:oxygen-independent coproporphyrinogen III oxidase [Ilumatobacteraceae bacterium]
MNRTGPIESGSGGVTAELLARYDQPGPRYTSYPTAVDFHDGFGPTEYAERLADASARLNDPLSLYVHLPFCESRCSFCACHVVIPGKQSVADVYLDRVVAEARATSAKLGERRVLQQYHWGGGTPTYYSPDALATLHHQILSEFELAPGAEVALEVDPRVTTAEHLSTLRELGFNRISMGVQDTDEVVQDLIGRHQTWEQTATLDETARRLGYESINIDLIYGLPGQDERSFARSLELVIGLRPDRLAVYSFALVPWMRPHQKRIDTSQLPDLDTKFALLSLAIERLTGAGYQQIGMDHFALPDDELAIAHADRTLSRNFMGYTTKRGTEIVGLGTSAISDVAGAYSQNHRRLASYYVAVDTGRLPTERGIALDDDDRLRRFVITELMCNGRLSGSEVAHRFGVAVVDYFAFELAGLQAPGGLIEAGLVRVNGADIEATAMGRPFIRNVAMAFDARLGGGRGDRVFSRTV